MTRGIRVAVLGMMTLLWGASTLPAQQYRQQGWSQQDGRSRWDRSYGAERSTRDGRYYRETRTSYGNNDYGYRNQFNDDRYYNNDRYGNNDYGHRGRSPGASAAIIGGSAAAGAALGAVSGGGKGAAIGAVIGGVSGLIIDQTTKRRHH